MEVYILRHGEAVDAAEVGGRDEPSRLTENGKAVSKAAAESMVKLGVAPDLILTSPYPRAAETARITAKCLKGSPPVKEDRSLEPGAPGPRTSASCSCERRGEWER